MGVVNIDLNNINLDDNFDEDLSIILFKFFGCFSKFEKRKPLKKKLNEELISVAWHPNSWWDWCVKKQEKIDRSYFEELEKCDSVVYRLGVLGHFAH